MKKRLRKKFHKHYLSDVVCDVSQNSFWRKTLFENKEHVPFLLTSATLQKEPSLLYLLRFVRRYRLHYQVSKVPHSQTTAWEANWGGGCDDYIMFCFQATEFPEICDYSANNPEAI